MLNTTNITPPRVQFLDERTGLISREWYRFFLNLYQIRENIGNTDNNLLGDALIGFKQANANGFLENAIARNVSLKLEEYVSVLDFGAIPDGITDSTQAFQNAYDVAPINGTIHVPSGDYVVTSVNGTKNVLWLADGINTTGWLLDLPGIVFSLFQNRILTRKTRTTSTDYSISEVQRICNYSGGTPGFVNSAGRFYTNASSDVTNFEWALIGQIDNYATAGENVGIYGQALKHATGPTWGGVFEARDLTNSTSATGGLVGAEVNVFANGNDVSSNRVGIDVIGGKGDESGTAPVLTTGIRINMKPSGGTFTSGITLDAPINTGIVMNNVGNKGIDFTSTSNAVGVDFSSAIFSSSTIRFASNQKIDCDAAGLMQIKTPATSQTTLNFTYASNNQIGLKLDPSAPGIFIQNNKVVGVRQAAIANSGNATTDAILAALRAHGLIET